MEEENDVLDWGAEDEESKNQDAKENGATDARLAAGDNDDTEDAVSLGDEEEVQDIYLYRQEEQTEPTAGVANCEMNIAPRSVGADDVPSTATPSSLQREDSLPPQIPSSKTGTPRRNSSTGRRSPQPTLAPRITHALPPKPVVTNVPFLPPSHPSIVEATAMSAQARTTGRSNGKGLTSGNELLPLPRGWEAREARSGSGGTYYYNVRTHESTWTRPSQEPSRHSRRAQPIDHDHVTDVQIVPPSKANTMSYNDRHYRPRAGTDAANAGGNTNDRHYRNREDVDSRFNPRPDQPFTPSPETSPRARERPRSLSPLPMSLPSRSARPPRSSTGGRNGNTDADSSIYRDSDSLPGSYPARDSWNQSNTYQESRRHSRQHYETPYDIPLNDNRLHMLPRNGNARGCRERNRPVHEESQNMSDSRTRSLPPDKRDTHIRDQEPRDHARHWPMLSRGQEGHQAISHPVVSPQSMARPQRKRDRPSRFGQPATSSILQPGPPSARLPTVETQTYPRSVVEDDPFVPDDIRSPPPHELQQRREVLDENSSLFQASENLENASSSEQHTRRARPPLPPQDAEFHEVSNRPRDRSIRLSQDHSTSLSRLSDQDGQPLMGSRDIQGLAHGNASLGSRSQPYGQSHNYENGQDREDSVADLARLAPEMRELMKKDVRYNIQARRFSRTAQDEGGKEIAAREEEIARESGYPGVPMGLPIDIRRPETEDKSTGLGNYPSGQTYAPRGPRAMHPSVNQIEITSPTMQTGFGPGPRGANRERSPPPHMGGRVRENGGWREERGGHMSERGGRRDRGRFNDYSRPLPSSASGPNTVPIGNHRKQSGNGSGGPSGLPMRMPIGLPVPEIAEMNQRQMRGGGSMRAGVVAASHPSRELQYDRGYGIDHPDRFRSGKFESDGPPPRRRDSSLPPFERQPLNIDAGGPQRDHFSISPLPTSTQPSQLARTWTPRGEAPPEVFMGNAGASINDRHTTSPLISRTSPHVDTGRPHSRHPDSRDRPGSSRGRPLPSEGRQTERFARQPNEPRRGGLEGRLSDRFDDSVTLRQTLPPNPDQFNGTPFESHGPDALARAKPRKSDFYGPPYGKRMLDNDAKIRDRHQQESSHDSSESYVPRELDMSHRDDNYNVNVDMDVPPQLHSKVGRDEYSERKRRPDNRTEMTRRPGSLLERLEMSAVGNDMQEETVSRSLSDRVQVPSKRDRGEMVGDRFGADDAFGVDDRDPASKKPRRKQARGRRVKMGQP
ncbi:hypothetical protein E4T56_gene10665 [Termitomyces sp. T112]|nr:hypothetical protein E4T56_gene10665 [Termitomyces sp. T112]